jgi:glycosyltransferase involved in cell wall biosynthesis
MFRALDAIVAPGSIPVAELETQIPTFIWADATFASLLDFYPGTGWTGLCQAAIKEGNAAELRAFARSELCIFSSEWAAQSAVRDYGLEPSRVEVVPYGANLDAEGTPADVRASIAAHREDVCNLLFIGADWDRKGGDLAVDVAVLLSATGLPTRLTVFGCRPPAEAVVRGDSLMDVRGYVRKGEPAGRDEVMTSFRTADLLIVPSRADATPMVIAEAASFGVPAVAADVGGIAELVVDGLTGYLLPREATAEDYASRVRIAVKNPRYEALARASRDYYERRLNWSTAGRTVRSLMKARLRR